MNNLLFVYGTLLNKDNEYALYLKNNSRFHSYGKTKGKLYDIGEYPGAILLPKGEDYIYGSILELDHPEDIFPIIDDYEGYGNGQSVPNEFIRLIASVETSSTIINCWVYVYNLPIEGLKLIKNGRYLK
jgi:gamma-glutamylcyclotransferase (GGCT)/AIG2-like uncharacterized protein YtfP